MRLGLKFVFLGFSSSLNISSVGAVSLVLVLLLGLVGARLLWKAGLGDPSSCSPDL